MNSYDYYSEAKELAEELRLAGFSNYEADILGAMEEGETGTEIFMIMRARLIYILAEKRMPQNLLRRATGLYEKLNDSLS